MIEASSTDAPASAPHVERELLVGMADVDAVQIYFLSYLRWIGESYELLFRSLGRPMATLLGEGFAQPVVHVTADYSAPVGLGDTVRQQTWLTEGGRTSLHFRDVFHEGGRLLAVVESVRAWISTEPPQRPQPAPDWLHSAARAASAEHTERRRTS